MVLNTTINVFEFVPTHQQTTSSKVKAGKKRRGYSGRVLVVVVGTHNERSSNERTNDTHNPKVTKRKASDSEYAAVPASHKRVSSKSVDN
jgi:hypothetical protein